MNMDEKNMCGGMCGCSCMKHFIGHKKVWGIIIIIALVFIIAKACDNDGGKDIQKDTIVVSGKGELTIKPDIATFSFSVM